MHPYGDSGTFAHHSGEDYDTAISRMAEEAFAFCGKPKRLNPEPRNIQRQEMHLLTTFFKKPLTDQTLYLEAALWLAISRLAILIVPFRWIAPFLGRHMASSDENDKNGDKQTEASVSRVIRTMSCHLPWECKCLAQAVSGKMMLRRRQIPSTLYLGVAKKENGDLNAHAWLRAGDIIILGGGGMQRFVVMSTFA